MTTAQAAVAKRVGRSIFAVLIGAGIELLSGSPYALVIIPILQGLGKWLREEKEYSLIPF